MAGRYERLLTKQRRERAERRARRGRRPLPMSILFPPAALDREAFNAMMDAAATAWRDALRIEERIDP